MRIIIWSFFAILIEQAVCFPSLNFGFGPSSEEVVPEQFLEDLKKLVSSGHLSKNDDTMKEMLNGLIDLDLGQNSESQTMELNENSTMSSSDPTQLPSSEVSKFLSVVQSISNDSSPSNQPKAPVVEIKSLIEWVELDRMIAKNPSLEGAIQESPELTQGDVKDNQVIESQSKENDIDKGPDHSEKPEPINPVSENQLIENDPAPNPNHLDVSSFASDSEIDRLLKNTFSLKKASQDEKIINPGFHANSSDWGIPQPEPEKDLSKTEPGFYSHSADWMRSQTDQKEDLSKEDSGFYAHSADWMTSDTDPKEDLPKAEEDEDPEENSSFTNSLMSKLNLKYWTDLNWGEFFPNPFA